MVAALVPVLAPAAPAFAVGCTDETPEQVGLLVRGCDDTTPPETTITRVTPERASGGVINGNTVHFEFAGSYSDGDTGSLTYECRFYNTATPPAWSGCGSGSTGSFAQRDLDESAGGPYIFDVRAIDSDDAGLPACDENLSVVCDGDPDIEDLDQSPATVTFKVDTVAPNTFITRGPVDSIRPDWPATVTASPELVLNSNESSGFECTLNGKAVACAEGTVALRELDGGAMTFVARAVDAAGNPDPTPASLKFFVPENIKNSRRSGWSRVKSSGSFGGDYLESSTVGSTLRIKGQRNVREVRLLAPAGPRLGKLQVRVGKSQWYTVDLHSRSPKRQRVYLVRDQYTPRQRGTIRIRVAWLPAGGSVAVDALVARS